MRILVETGDYDLVNLGDVSMLQVAVSRLRALWPDATIQVVTRSPERLAQFCPSATPLQLHASPGWYKQSIRARLYRLLPAVLWKIVAWADRHVRTCLPALARQLDLWNASLHGDRNHFLHVDLVVATGGGYITDNFIIPALLVLDTLGIAARLGKPVALFGQGLGPLQQPALYALASHVFALADLIALREQSFSKPLLHKLGIPTERVTVTGDDAISLAYAARRTHPGQGIGVNMRIATYAEVDQDMVERVRTTLQHVAHTYQAPLLPVPIAIGKNDSNTFGGQNDMQPIQSLIGTSTDSIINQVFERPEQVIDQVSRCRLVVTGSYHAAVFALAQGIPAVCLARSTYYAHKFLGLADQFGAGCEVLFLNDTEIEPKLADAITRAWNAADSLRPHLLAAAQQQSTASQQAYERLFHLVSSRIESQSVVPQRGWSY